MNLPEFVSVTPEEITVEGVDQSLYHVGTEHKLPLLLGLLAREDWLRILIFVNTRVGVDWLAKKLKGNGWPAEGITGDLPQRQRFRLMEGFKNGRIKILVATDVASRGIHVEDISHVVNYDLPQDAENYIHRIGRTARAGKTGRAISLACEKYVFHLELIEEMLEYKIPIIWPEDDWFVADKSRAIPAERKHKGKKSVRRRPPRPGEKRPFQRKSEKKPLKKAERGSVPGALFGFGPEPKSEIKSDPQATQKEPARKKRRRRPKKKSPEPNGDVSK
jgi:ATP-dependent RNA helicase RhlB